MNILLTGANGYIGRNLIPSLIKNKHHIYILTRNKLKLKNFTWFKKVIVIERDFYNSDIEEIKNQLINIDCFIHLSWMNLPNYNDPIHVNENLPKEKNFLIKILKMRIKKLIVAGTCMEYGMVNGEVSEITKTNPSSQYGIAKDQLRIFLESLQSSDYEFSLTWLRLFYVFGNDQPERFIIPQLEKAISNNEKYFKMSHGNQVRDFIHIQKVVEKIIYVLENNLKGIVNISSGKPLSLFDFINNRKKELNSKINLDRGCFEVPSYEPEEFWGVSKYF